MFLEHDDCRFGTSIMVTSWKWWYQLLFSASDIIEYVYLMYNGYVQTTRGLIQQEIMEILLLQSNAMLLPPIFYFSYFAMNIKATCSFHSLLASNTCILSKQLIKTLSNCTKSKINNHFIMVCYHGNGKFLMFDSWAIVIIHSMYW